MPSSHAGRPEKQTVAVIGVGRIGSALVGRLHDAGHAVRAYDVRDVTGTDGLDVVLERTLAAAVDGAEVVLTALPGNRELAELVLGSPPGGSLLELMGPGTTLVDVTSAAPQVGEQAACIARRLGRHYLEAPLGGGVAAARDGALTLYVGGDRPVLDRHRECLSSFAARIHHMGPNGAGYLTKLLINQIWFGHALATAEALLVGQAGGLDPGALRQAMLGSAADSTFVRDHLPELLRGDYLETFGLDRCVEELELLERLADSSEVAHPLLGVVAQLHREALETFGPVDAELMGIALLERRAHRQLRS